MTNTLDLPESVTDRAGYLPPAFVCSWTTGVPNAASIRVAGELDLATVPRLEETLRDAQSQARLVVLDLRELVFMDSAGVHAIVNATIRARQVGRRLALLRGPPNVDCLFTLTGTRDAVEIRDIDSVAPTTVRPGRSMGFDGGVEAARHHVLTNSLNAPATQQSRMDTRIRKEIP